MALSAPTRDIHITCDLSGIDTLFSQAIAVSLLKAVRLFPAGCAIRGDERETENAIGHRTEITVDKMSMLPEPGTIIDDRFEIIDMSAKAEWERRPAPVVTIPPRAVAFNHRQSFGYINAQGVKVHAMDL